MKKTIWILRKHPIDRFCGALEAFTISGQYPNHAACANAAKDKNKRSSSYFYSVGKLVVEV